MAEAGMLKAIITTGAPMAAGETYHIEALFCDVYKKEDKVTTNVNFVMK